MGKKNTKNHIILALLTSAIFCGLAIFFVLDFTCNTSIHSFFANNYIRNWFEFWSFQWHNSYITTVYPQLFYQFIILLTFIYGIKFGVLTFAIISTGLFITEIYRFISLMISGRKVRGYTSLITLLSSLLIAALHIFRGYSFAVIIFCILIESIPGITQLFRLQSLSDPEIIFWK
ncbi:hypothetical protein GTQ40_14525 [Flavobacteriaceae bacterium R38]|nr:hypothetical protein [Flavobacteriaceae bacterium R38]